MLSTKACSNIEENRTARIITNIRIIFFFYSQTALGPWKFVLDMRSLSCLRVNRSARSGGP